MGRCGGAHTAGGDLTRGGGGGGGVGVQMAKGVTGLRDLPVQAEAFQDPSLCLQGSHSVSVVSVLVFACRAEQGIQGFLHRASSLSLNHHSGWPVLCL